MDKFSSLKIKVFIMLLIGPTFLYFFISQHLDLENHENHALLTVNDVKKAAWYEKTKKIEEIYEENIPYKNEFTKLNYLFDIVLWGNIDSDSVLLGKDNWLFYKKDNCIEDYCGKLEVTQQDITNTIEAMERFESFCKEREVQIVYLITPNKETIYGDLYFPDYIKIVGESSRTDTLLNAIWEETDLNTLYPEKELCFYRDNNYQVYRKYDTHWNNIGAYIGTDCLLQALDMESLPLEELSVNPYGFISGDLANMIALSDKYSDDINYAIDDYKNDITAIVLEDRAEANLNYTHWWSDSQNDQVIMCIGDSFLGVMEQYLAKNYRESYFMHKSNYQAGIIDTIRPDVIVISSTERSFPWLYIHINEILDKENSVQ